MSDDLLALAARCESEESSRELDRALHRVRVGVFPKEEAPEYTASLDAAVTLVPEGCWRHSGSGKLDEDEPLWGCVVEEPWAPPTAELGSGESNHNEALAICAAALRARHALSQDTHGVERKE